MLYMLEIRYTREQRDDALSYFWTHGTTHYEGKVTLKGAWVATHDQIAFAVVDAADEDEMVKAAAPLKQFGDVIFVKVTSIDEI